MRSLFLIVILTLALALSACGGGGGNPTPTPGAAIQPADTALPEGYPAGPPTVDPYPSPAEPTAYPAP